MTDDIDVERFAHSLPDRYIRCRELGHVWRPNSARWVTEQRVYERVLRCTSCRTEKQQLINQHGHIVSSGYKYTDGYLAQHVTGIEGSARDVYRLEAVTRYIDAPKRGQ